MNKLKAFLLTNEDTLGTLLAGVLLLTLCFLLFHVL